MYYCCNCSVCMVRFPHLPAFHSRLPGLPKALCRVGPLHKIDFQHSMILPERSGGSGWPRPPPKTKDDPVQSEERFQPGGGEWSVSE